MSFTRLYITSTGPATTLQMPHRVTSKIIRSWPWHLLQGCKWSPVIQLFGMELGFFFDTPLLAEHLVTGRES